MSSNSSVYIGSKDGDTFLKWLNHFAYVIYSSNGCSENAKQTPRHQDARTRAVHWHVVVHVPRADMYWGVEILRNPRCGATRSLCYLEWMVSSTIWKYTPGRSNPATDNQTSRRLATSSCVCCHRFLETCATRYTATTG